MKECNCKCCTCKNYEEIEPKFIPERGDLFKLGQDGENIYICLAYELRDRVNAVCIQSRGGFITGRIVSFEFDSDFVKVTATKI